MRFRFFYRQFHTLLLVDKLQNNKVFGYFQVGKISMEEEVLALKNRLLSTTKRAFFDIKLGVF